jgi:predicted molibdopterin-dependent oxidoreductase YjgC
MSSHAPARFVRLNETYRATVNFVIDGHPASALQGDTLLTAMLQQGDHVRRSEFGGEKRAGFCLMGACQDCWVWTAEGGRLRACSTEVEEGMAVSTHAPELTWPHHA